MIRFPLALGLAATLGLIACDMPAPVETCTDRSGATYVKPAGGCPAFVAPAVKKPAPKAAAATVAPVPVVERTGGNDGGGDSGGGW
jgi:hypothetical protein